MSTSKLCKQPMYTLVRRLLLPSFGKYLHGFWKRTARSSLAFNTKNGSRILEDAPVVCGFIERLKSRWLWRRGWSLQAGCRLLLAALMPHSLRMRNSRGRGLLGLCSCCAFRSARVRPPVLHLFHA